MKKWIVLFVAVLFLAGCMPPQPLSPGIEQAPIAGISPKITTAGTTDLTGDQCNKLLDHGLYNIFDSAREENSSEILEKLFCSEDYGSSSGSKRQQLDAVYKALSLGWGSSKQSASSYYSQKCDAANARKDYAVTTATHTAQIYNKAVDAWGSCMDAAKNGWQVKFDTGGETGAYQSVDFTVSYTGDGKVYLQGVAVVPEGAYECRSSDAGFFRSKVDRKTEVKVDNTGWAMNCERKIAMADKDGEVNKTAPAATISVLTGANSFRLDIPTYEEPSLSKKRFEMVTNTIKDVKDTIEDFKVPSGTVIAWNPPSDMSPIMPPKGWLLCDGSNGTPNLNGKFIRGTVAPGDVRGSGGTETHTHTASVTVPSEHNNVDNGGGATPAGHNHTHTVTNSATTHLPPYYNMVYIIRK